MTSFVIDCAKAIGGKLQDKLLDVAIREAHYLCCYKGIVENFEKEKEELESNLKRIEGDVKEASNRNEVILENVDFHLKTCHNLIEEDTKKKRTWFFGWCPNCIWQYGQGKKLANKAEEIKKLKVVDFGKVVGRPRQLPGVTSQDYIEFKSRDSAYRELLDAFKDGNNYMVGLYGMGGSGKTTLVKKVGKTLKESNLFDEVVFTAVSSDPDIKKIQNNIASPLGLELKQEDEQGIRAKKLLLRLTNGQKILIILDDVWQELNFEDIGIPSNSDYKGCRILLTSRESRNLKSCQVTSKLELLSDDDARNLFFRHAGLRDDSPKDVKKLALQIADECKRLPIAIVTIARALKDQPPEIWRAALKSLKEFKKIGDIDEEQMIYRSVELSYKNLKKEEVKKLFLLCSLFPEDYEIPEEELTRYGIGLGLFGDVNSYEEARNDVLIAKRKLLDACLLLEGEKERCVKMHDLVRDSAHWITKGEIQVVMGSKIKAPVKDVTVRCLYCDNVHGVPNQLDCTELNILILIGEEVPTEAFFKGLKNLRVLTLKSGKWDWPSSPSILLPLSSEFLQNIRSLCLETFKLADISFMGILKVLETLELKRCFIDQLPNGIVEFKKLKLLRLESCRIQRNPYQVISKLSQIEELYFVQNEGWKEELDSKGIANLFDKDSISPEQLKRYHIEIGWYLGLYECSALRAIAIKHFDASITNATIKGLVQRAELLELREMQGDCRTIIPDFVKAIGSGLNELTELELNSCATIKCLVNTTNLASLELSNVVKLRLMRMGNLEKICNGPPLAGSFEKIEEIKISDCRQLCGTLFVGNWNLGRLKVLSVDECPMLTSLITASDARSLEQLEELQVEDCKELKCMIEIEEEGGEIVANDGDQKNYGSMIPNLKTVYIEGCEKLELMCSFCSKSSSEIRFDSKVADVDPMASRLGLQMPDSKCLPPFHISQCLSRQSLILHNVRKLTLGWCPKLMSLFTLSVAQTMSLEELKVDSCDSLKCIIMDLGEDHANTNYVYVFPKLKKLSIEDCSQLEFLVGQYHFENQNHNDLSALKEATINNPTNMITICPTNYYTMCGPMKKFHLTGCPQFIMKSISDWRSIKELSEIEKHFTALERVLVNGSKIEGIFCLEDIPLIGQQFSSGLKRLWLTDLAEMKYICRGPKHIMYFQNLEDLQIEGCKELEIMLSASVFRSLPQLTILTIKDCENLEQIIEEEKNMSNAALTQTQPCFPRLKQLIVHHCNKLKVLFSISTSYEFQELTCLVVSKVSRLEKVFETDARLKVEFRKLRYLTLVQLDSLTDVCQGISLQNVAYRFVHNCLKLCLDSTTTDLFHMWRKYYDDPENLDYDTGIITQRAFNNIAHEITSENSKPKTMSKGHEDEDSGVLSLSKREMPSSQINEKAETEAVREVPSSEIQPKATSSVAIPLQNSISQDSKGNVQQVPISKKAEASTLSEPQSSPPVSFVPYPHQTYAKGTTPPHPLVSSQPIIQGRFQEGPSSEKDNKLKSSKYSEPGTSLPTPSDDSIQIEKEAASEPPSLVQEAVGENESMNYTPHRVDKLSDLAQSVKEPAANDTGSEAALKKTAPEISLTNTELKDSSESFTLSQKASPGSVKEAQSEIGGGKVIVSEIAVMETSSTESASAKGPPHKTPSHEQKTLGQNDTPQSFDPVKHVGQSVHESSFTRLPVLPTLQNLGDSSLSPNQMEVSRANFYNSKDTEAHPGNLQDHVNVLMPSTSIIAKEHLASRNNQLAKVILAEMLERPLRDIAGSKAYILCLQTALNFLSCLSVEDGVLSNGLKNVIGSLHHEFPAILCLFKEAFATINKFAMIEEREKSIKEELAWQKEASLNLVSEISKTKKSLDEALQKKASLNDQITRLLDELELENVNEEMSQMMEGTKLAWQELFTIDHKWMLLCSQFEQSWRTQKAISSIDHSKFMSSSVCSLQEISIQEVGDTQDSKPSASINAASHPIIKDKLVSNVLADLEGYLKMPLKDIATSKVDSLRLLSALQFLSHLSLEDVPLMDGLKATIVSLHHEFPSILSSFKQALASIERFAALKKKEKSIVEKLALQKKATVTPVPILSKTEGLTNEADQEKEASLEDHITGLQLELESKEDEIKKCEATLSSLQERENKCAADTIRLNQEFETVNMEKSQMIEAYRKAREDLFEVDYKWSTLCSQFQQSHMASGDLS